MVIAREKKKSNISQMKLYKILHDETRIWYEDLAEKMKNEGIIEKGHLLFVKDIITKLNTYHLSLLQDKNEIKNSGITL